MQAFGAEEEHIELDDLFLGMHEQQHQVEVEATEASEENNKKFEKERQEAEKT